MAENKILKNEEEKLFFNRIGLIDSTNCIYNLGLSRYLVLIQYIEAYKPKEIIQIADASTPYIVKKKFGGKVYHEFLELVNKRKTIFLSPAKTESDLWLIQLAHDNPEHFILSLDKFSDYHQKYIQKLNIIKFVYLKSNFYFTLNLKWTPNKHEPKKSKIKSVIKQITTEKEQGVV